MVNPKGTVPDHWTWRDGRAAVTGWHVPAPKKRGKAAAEAPPVERRVSRGAVAVEVPRPKVKPEQGSLL